MVITRDAEKEEEMRDEFSDGAKRREREEEEEEEKGDECEV